MECSTKEKNSKQWSVSFAYKACILIALTSLISSLSLSEEYVEVDNIPAGYEEDYIIEEIYEDGTRQEIQVLRPKANKQKKQRQPASILDKTPSLSTQLVSPKPLYSTLKFSISETNDAAILGLQEAITPEAYRPNDVGYTHGIKVEVEKMNSSFWGLNGAFKATFVSDLITEFKQFDSSIFSSEIGDPQIQALDVYRLGFSFEEHARRSGFKVLFGSEFEYITNTTPFDSAVSFLAGSSRQAAWHDYYNSVDYNYYDGDLSRYSANLLFGVGLENNIFGSFAKVDMKVGALAKLSPSEQARNESKLLGELKLSFNDTVKNERYYLNRSGNFIFSLGAKGEFGVGQKLDTYAGIEQNFDFGQAQFELAFLATLPIIQNDFDYKDFTIPRVFDESQPFQGGILDYEPVYTISLSLLW